MAYYCSAAYSVLDLIQKHQPDKPKQEKAPAAIPVGSTGAVIEAAESPGDWEIDAAGLDDLNGLLNLEEPAFRALAALRAGMHVIFTGPPGTGKTKLAACICEKAGFPYWTVPATDQWTTFDTIGGYFPAPQEDGTDDRLDFLPGAVVDSIEKGQCLIIDEINRADIDKAFGELFTLLTGNTVTLPYRRRSKEGFQRVRLQVGTTVIEPDVHSIPVPDWWRIIGAMNDADKASLKRLSLAFVRRFAFIAIPVPAKAVYETILRKEIAPYASPKLDDLCARLVSLFAEPTTGLAKIGLPLGPAIPLAMLKHAKSEFDMDATRTGETVFASVVALYLVPQLQGRPDLHSDALALITPLLGPRSAEFEITLGVWTGGAG